VALTRVAEGQILMTDAEIEVVAEAGGCGWYPGRTHDPLLRVVSDRYRTRARIALAALERFRAGRDHAPAQDEASPPAALTRDSQRASSGPDLTPGATVVYRPPGDRRAYPCRIVEIQGSHAYLEPLLRACTGWVSLESLQPLPVEQVSNDQ
jgi:hypothetical protein